MKQILLTAMLLALLVEWGGCSNIRELDNAPIAVMVDSYGGIGWARAPVGYYAGKTDDTIRKYARSVGLEDREAPTFPLGEDTLRSMLATVRAGKPDTEPGKVNFVFVFFYNGKAVVKVSVGRDCLKRVIDLLPRDKCDALFSMYINAVRFNNPGARS